MIDAAQFAGCYENEGIVFLGDVVYGEIFFRQGNHQAAGAFYQYDVVATGEFAGGALYFAEVDGAVVDTRRKVGRAGVGEDFGHGEPFFIFRQVACAHDTAVKVDVFGMAGVAGLDEFLGDDTLSVLGYLLGVPGGAVAFSGIGIDTADEIDVGIHVFLYFIFYLFCPYRAQCWLYSYSRGVTPGLVIEGFQP